MSVPSVQAVRGTRAQTNDCFNNVPGNLKCPRSPCIAWIEYWSLGKQRRPTLRSCRWGQFYRPLTNHSSRDRQRRSKNKSVGAKKILINVFFFTVTSWRNALLALRNIQITFGRLPSTCSVISTWVCLSCASERPDLLECHRGAEASQNLRVSNWRQGSVVGQIGITLKIFSGHCITRSTGSSRAACIPLKDWKNIIF